MSVRLTAAVAAGQAAAALSRRFGVGGGTVIAGHVAQRVYPNALQALTARLPQGSVLLSGTNGKTTTSRLVATIASVAGWRPLHNRAGANLMSGVTTAVVEQASVRGQPRGTLGVFEVDEATLPIAVERLHPRLVVLTNLFRDQLDRYGEVEFVADLWRRMLQTLPETTALVLNADDPLIAALGRGRANVTYFGVADRSVAVEREPHALDARLCTECGGEYQYDALFYGHLGHFRCPACGFRRVRPGVEVTSVSLDTDRGSSICLQTPTETLTIQLRLPGLYNVYNAAAAAACAVALGLSGAAIRQGLERFEAAFGRLERIPVEGRELMLALVKNPVGFNEVLRTMLAGERSGQLVIIINDLFADGTDVSWLWDVDFELLRERVTSVVCSGLRADDMAVRLKYAQVPVRRIVVEPHPRRAIDRALHASEHGETIHVLATYTAMLETRKLLRRTGYVRGFWED